MEGPGYCWKNVIPSLEAITALFPDWRETNSVAAATIHMSVMKTDLQFKASLSLTQDKQPQYRSDRL